MARAYPNPSRRWPDYDRGAGVYAEDCAACHRPTGAGQKVDGAVGSCRCGGTRSFNWGAGMASVKNAAEFIHANMPLGAGGTLTPQQACDVGLYVDSQVRPQDPRSTRDAAATLAKFDGNQFSMDGKTVSGAVLGDPGATPPAGTVPEAQGR